MKRILFIALLLVMTGTMLYCQPTVRTINVLKWIPQSAALPLSSGDTLMYMFGDTLVLEVNGVRTKMLLTGASNAAVMVYDSVLALWKPGAGGGGGAVPLNDILNPTGATSLSMGTNIMSQTWTGPNVANSLAYGMTFLASGADPGDVGLRLSTSGTPNPISPFQATVKGTANGVEVDSTGRLKAIGTGEVDATMYNGNAVIAGADLDTNLVYNDETNYFNQAQSVSGSNATAMLLVTNTNTSPSNYGLYGTTLGGYGVAGFGGTTGGGVMGYNAAGGIGGYFYSLSGYPLVAEYNGVTVLRVNSAGIQTAYLDDLGSGVITTAADIRPYTSLIGSLGSAVYRYAGVFAHSMYPSVLKMQNNTSSTINGDFKRQGDSLKYTNSKGEQNIILTGDHVVKIVTLSTGDSVTTYIDNALPTTWIGHANFVGGQGDDGGIITVYFTADSAHVSANRGQPIPNLQVVLTAERIQ